MGFVPQREPDIEKGLEILLESLRQEDIGSTAITALNRALESPPGERPGVGAYLEAVYDALGQNPAPRREINALLKYFDNEQLTELLQISPSSVQRYARGERNPPEPVVDRIHWLALVVGYLTGTYNEFGVRRWFERPRTALDGKGPKDALLADKAWTSESDGARQVEQLARALIGMPAT